jgi:hypothetical protein
MKVTICNILARPDGADQPHRPSDPIPRYAEPSFLDRFKMAERALNTLRDYYVRTCKRR